MRFLLLLFTTILSFSASAQMEVNGTILYGNEWIDYDKTYAKVVINEDGLYRVSRQELADNGIPVNDISFDKLHMWSYGNEVGFYVAPDQSYIEFYGEKNKIQLDKFLYEDPSFIFNEEYSLISDNAAYFITWTDNVNPLISKLITTDLTSNTLSPEPFYTHQEMLVAKNIHYKPTLGDEVRYSNFVSSEGFGTALLKTTDYNIPISKLSTESDFAQVAIRYGGNNFFHRTEIRINNILKETPSSNKDTIQLKSYEIPVSEIDGNVIKVKLTGVASTEDRNRIAHVKVNYPREFHTNGQVEYRMHLKASANTRYIEIEGYEENELPILYNLTENVKIIPEKLSSGIIAFLLEGSDQAPVLQLSSSTNGIKYAKSITTRSFISYDDPNYDYLLVSSDVLRNEDNTDWVQEYANYRASNVGGEFNPVITDIDQLYDQFSYGVDKHCLSVRNYAYWADKNYDDPKFMFIIGKGVEYPLIRQDSIVERTNFYVPTWGNPGSDNLVLASFDSPVPILPVGRLAAGSYEDVKNYLQKVKDHDQNTNNPSTIEDRLWQKKVLHLSGGASASEQESLFNSLGAMADTLKNNMYGADVLTFRKKTTDPIGTATSERIFDQINNGLSWITFFGHASVGSFDFNLDNVENYQNAGKYPLLMSLGCYSGNIHTSDNGGISESFVLAKDKGSIAFIAASGSAYIGVQNQFGREFHSQAGGESYGKSIGEITKRVIEEFEESRNFSYVTFYQQLTFHGDPAVKFPNFQGPDFTPDATTIGTNPKFIDTYEEDFEVCFDITNLGKYNRDSINLKVTHLNPQGEIEFENNRRILAPGNRENYCFTIPILSRELVGQNRILVHVDSDNEVEEFPSPAAESNNKLVDQNGNEGFEFFILNNSAVPTFPEEFAIVNTEKVSLIANTFNALGDPNTFFVEIDTTMLFDSPMLVKKTFDNIRAVVKWDIDFNLMNETVHYWRVGTENASGEIAWRESSFVYEPGQRAGWSQEHYFQFLNNEFENMSYIDSLRELRYATNVKDIRFLMGSPFNEFYINEKQWNTWKKDIPYGLIMTLFDPIKGDPVKSFSENPLYGSVLPSGRTTTLQFPTSTLEEREHLISVIRDSLPDNYIVACSFVYSNTTTTYNLQDWIEDKNLIDDSILEALESKGASKLLELIEIGASPYTLVFENGTGTVLAEEYQSDPTEQVETKFEINGLWNRGEMTSELIGPATSWSNLEYSFKQNQTLSIEDTISMDIIGVSVDLVETLLIEDSKLTNIDLSGISVMDSPFLKFRLKTRDVVNLSVIQPDQFRVYYTGIPDLAIQNVQLNLSENFTDQGNPIKSNVEIVNNSKIPLGSTSLSMKVINDQNESIEIVKDVPELISGETVEINIEYDTKSSTGEYVFEYQLNKLRSPIEKYYFNNFALNQITIKPDTINPILDVTFDGVNIFHGDIISSKPLIRVTISDENKYLYLNDLDNVSLLLTSPDGTIEEINNDSPNLAFFPAEQGEDNISTIEFTPELIMDGNYTLSVSGSDQSGNTSGALKYEVEFRIFNEEMISDVFNYPNPFSSSTQFIFTLTGDEEPDNILIRIMTLSGKVVREITSFQLGTLRIGMNKTEYKWDGTDEFGEKLGNGTYLYQVITKKADGTDYERFNDSTQNNTNYLFNKGFGKLVIIR